MRPALRAILAAVAAVCAAAGGSFLAELVDAATRPWRRGMPDVPLRLDQVRFLGPHSLAATAVGIALAPSIALIIVAAIDRPALRRTIGVVLGGSAAAALIVALVQSNAAPAAGDNLTDIVVGLVALLIAAGGLALSHREPLSLPVPGPLRALAAVLPLAVMIALGWTTLGDAWTRFDAPPAHAAGPPDEPAAAAP